MYDSGEFALQLLKSGKWHESYLYYNNLVYSKSKFFCTSVIQLTNFSNNSLLAMNKLYVAFFQWCITFDTKLLCFFFICLFKMNDYRAIKNNMRICGANPKVFKKSCVYIICVFIIYIIAIYLYFCFSLKILYPSRFTLLSDQTPKITCSFSPLRILWKT